MALQEAKSAPGKRRYLMGWKMRHLGVLLIGVLATYGFLELRANWSAMHQWKRAVGDASVVMISLAMAIGPLSRLWPGARRLVPWQREFGVWGVVLAAVHTAIILDGWVEWDFMRLFGFAMHPQFQRYVMVLHGFGLANAIGIAALLYGIVLGVSSNGRSQKLLGGAVWKFLQQGAYVLWVLILVHTAYFLYLNFLDFHRSLPAPNRIQMPFAVMVMLIAALQGAAFLATWRTGRRRAVRARP